MRKVKPENSFLLLFTYENISGWPCKVSIQFMKLGITTAGAYNVTNVFTGENLGIIKPWYGFNTDVNPTGATLLYAEALDIYKGNTLTVQ